MSKIAIIGGGSSTFTPRLVRLFIESELLRGSEISLMDIDAHRLEVMDRLCWRLVQKEEADLTIESTSDRRQALNNADFVISAISVGGFDAWELDIEIPARYGIFMPIADSIGPGGIMRAFRHVPPLVAMCKDLEELSPSAWVFNYTNPLTANCVAMGRIAAIRTVGLCTCSVVPRDPRHLAELIGVEPAQVVVPPPAGGLNHCSAILDLRLRDGRDALPLVLDRAKSSLTGWILQTHGVLPYCSGHWAEFYPSLCRLEDRYDGKLQGLKMEHGLRVHDMDNERTRVRKWDRLAEEWAEGDNSEVSLDALPPREGVQVVEIMEALIDNRNEVHVVNVANHGAIDGLPDEAIVEVSSVVGGYGISPINVGPLPDALAAALRHQMAVQELTVEAALTGSKQRALDAFLLDPQISATLTPSESGQMLDELLAAEAQWLPQFSS